MTPLMQAGISMTPGPADPINHGPGMEPVIEIWSRTQEFTSVDTPNFTVRFKYRLEYVIKETVTLERTLYIDGPNGPATRVFRIDHSYTISDSPEMIFKTTYQSRQSDLDYTIPEPEDSTYREVWTFVADQMFPEEAVFTRAINGQAAETWTGITASSLAYIESHNRLVRLLEWNYWSYLPEYFRFDLENMYFLGESEGTRVQVGLTPALENLRSYAAFWGDQPFAFADPLQASMKTPSSKSKTLAKLQYKFVLTPSSPATVHWLEKYAPKDQSQQPAYVLQSWEPQIGDTESPVYTIDPLGLDPLDANASQRRPDQDGTWEVILLDGLAVDANRDGQIKLASEDNSDATTADKPYRFWINDDDDSGDTEGSDIPNPSSTDAADTGLSNDGSVDGVRDLVDFFPVFLDIKQLLTALPPSASVKYKLKQADSAVNFVYTKLNRAGAMKYQIEDKGAIFGFNLDKTAGQAETRRVTDLGGELSEQFLTGIKDQDWGVILVEGRSATDKPLVLSVEKADGTVIAEIQLELKLSPVEEMFRHLNLRNGPDTPAGLIGQTGAGHTAIPKQMNECSAFPDEPGDAKWLFFVHGYNVSGAKARGWNSEMFKRFYWSQNKARFVGVTWFGNPDTGNVNIVQGYHWAVRNAVPSAQALVEKINTLPGSKTVIGHSQGCWLTALAVADYGLSIANLCLIDAAFAQECFEGDSATDTTNMVPTEWQAYPQGTWSANWYRHFTVGGLPSSDARSTLTWNSRLASALDQTAVSSFYSSTEDVLATYPGTIPSAVVENAFNAFADWDLSNLGNFAWVSQEKTKGSKALLTQGSDYGGWGPNLTDRPNGSTDPIYYWVNGAGGRFLFSPSELPQLDVAMVRRAPMFDPGYSPKGGAFRNYDPSVLRGPNWIQQLYDTTSDTTSGGAIAATHRTELLAEAFPALSLPVGANETPRLQTNNYNMPVQFASLATWPRGAKDSTGVADWHHSDIRAVAYIFQYRLFDKLTTISNQLP